MKSKYFLPGLVSLSLLPAAVSGAFAGDAQLPKAAKQGDRTAVLALLKQKESVNATLADGTTALHWAATNGDLELTKALLKAGANPNAATRIGAVTPLNLASVNGNADIIQALLQGGADPNTASSNGTTPLMIAAASGNVAAVNALLDKGAKINAKESIHEQTPLMFAAAKNRDAVIRTLIQRGADPNITSKVIHLERPRFDEDGNPIVRGGEAGAKGRASASEATYSSAPAGDGATSATSPTGKTVTAEAGEPRAPRQRGEGRGARAADPSLAAELARRAAAVTTGGNAALHLAAREGNLAATRALVEAGANINLPNAGDKTTPILAAICNGHYDVAKFLLDYGADANQPSVDGLTPLYAVIDTQWAPVGWAPNPITDQEATTYLDLMKALLDKKANPNAKLVKKLWFRPTHHDECWIGTAGSTPFWRAAQATDITAMKLLKSYGADPKIATNDGDNALMVAAGLGWNGNFSRQAQDSPFETVKYCLELGLDPLPQDAQGYTALAGAAYRGDIELVKLLISKGAKLDARTSRGWSVTDMANGPSLRSSVPVKHPEIVELLLKHGAPPLTVLDGEEILGVIRRKPTTPAAAKTNEKEKP